MTVFVDLDGGEWESAEGGNRVVWIWGDSGGCC